MDSAQPFHCTVLQRLHKLIAEHPDTLYCTQPVSTDIYDGWRDVSFRDLAYAINYMIRWIRTEVSASSDHLTLAYLGGNDIRYCAFVFACMQLRHKAVLLSSRNSEQASTYLLGAIGCNMVLYSTERTRQADALTAADHSLEAWRVPDLWDVFGGEPDDEFSRIPIPDSDPEERVAVYIHSSGTTGLPKPVPLTNGYFHALENALSLPLPEDRTNGLVIIAEPGKIFLSASPFFHLMGLFNIVAPVMFGTPFLLCPDRPLSTELLAQIMDEKSPETAVSPPYVLEEISSTDAGMETLKKFHGIVFGGAPLAPSAGDRISEFVHLEAVLGTSECGVFGTLKHVDKADWKYLEWNPNHGVEMRDIGNNLHELVVPRGASRDSHCIFHSFPGFEEYRTGDIFSQHPRKSGSWLYSGRLDDVIVLSNGEKFNPISMENIISSHPLISRAVVIGQGRFQAGVLVEPDWNESSDENEWLIDEIWPVIQKANEIAPGHAQLMKGRIGFASRNKPFKLTPKGTIRRPLVLQDYAEEIEALYTRKSDEGITQIPADASNLEIMDNISGFIKEILSITSVPEDADIFALGVDSLQTLRLSQMLQASLRSTYPEIVETAFSNQQLYARPTLGSLAEYVSSLIHGGISTPAAVITETDADRESRLAEMVSKYSNDLNESHVVILTGSTGSLGAYLLYELLQDPTVSKIYCLNRGADAASRQLKSMQDKGLTTLSQFPRRVEFLEAQFGSERLGLESAKYEALLLEVDTILHNAWNVNFNHRVEAFEETHIQGVRRIIDFSIASERMAHIHFVSSIATIEGYSHDKGPSIPEIVFTDPTVVLRQGYGESKHVSERICAAASAKRGVPTSIHRVGQIGGPTTREGMWNKQEWLPSLIATSKTIKKIPSSLGSGTVQWVPVDQFRQDITAKVITDIVRSRRATQDGERCAAFHIVNPETANWQSLLPAVIEYFDAEPVPLTQWIKTLESLINPTETDLQDKPALKILDFFRTIAMGDESGPWTETTKAQEASNTLRRLEAVDASLMKNWMEQWDF
ncbi:unnamed protein product [Penicillium salamii]|uniref:Carrier domain-containing protein n=1 Tax=Penicillium salamii TaxID=1612424 RepID=A0A9W4NLA1_9EURO|nr:unnamed protein product [Penicillium salamii]CAG8203723.1 unnamed protein product [Penicillium salamii]CAG8204574.1 unnamed protein product [Penicillium salamii]CAG8211823.1 unnamed protein product [Penicillium salamii]CAG8219515.1 unnamed protein product [Penicillium salamii]